MATWIALLRGVNVGGNNRLPMQSLREMLTDLGHTNIKTYIQSGNAVFDSNKRSPAAIGRAIKDAVAATHGFAPPVLVLTAQALRAAIAANPYAVDSENEKHLHLFFLEGAPASRDLSALHADATAGEQFTLTGQVVYLLTPAGLGRSKVGAKLVRFLRTPTTARNLRSARKILALADE